MDKIVICRNYIIQIFLLNFLSPARLIKMYLTNFMTVILHIFNYTTILFTLRSDDSYLCYSLRFLAVHN
jgi:uncharacterized membrane protein YesL